MPDDILAKVRKILTKAEDPATTPAEAEAYTAKAAELIAAYGIDRALLAEQDPGCQVVGDRVVVVEPPYALDKAGLLSTVAGALRCRVVQRVRYVDGAKQTSLHLFGFDADLARAEMLYTSVLLQAVTQLNRTRPPFGESVQAFRRSWLAGFTGAIGRRLREAEQWAQQVAEAREQPGDAERPVALVLADRSHRVDEALHMEYPQLRTARPRALSGSGGRAGWQAGQRADLGGTRVGDAARRILT